MGRRRRRRRRRGRGDLTWFLSKRGGGIDRRREGERKEEGSPSLGAEIAAVKTEEGGETDDPHYETEGGERETESERVTT